MPASPTPIVSVLIATYNAAPFLEAAIRSVLAQTLDDLEIVVVDDVSADDSPAIAERLAREDARVRPFRMDVNAGPAGARNRAIEAARGRWLAIVDSDDLIEPGRLARLVEAAEAAGADMVADDLLVFEHGAPAGGTPFLAARDRTRGPFDVDLRDYLHRTVMYGAEPNLGFLKPLIRRAALDAHSVRYDETLRIAEDDDLIARLLLAGLSYRIVPVPGYFYRKHGASISHRLNTGALEAIARANDALTARVECERPDAKPECEARRRSFARALAFEAMIAALKARRLGRALATLAGTPGMIPLLRMPLAGRLRRLRRQRTTASDSAGNEMDVLTARREALSQL